MSFPLWVYESRVGRRSYLETDKGVWICQRTPGFFRITGTPVEFRTYEVLHPSYSDLHESFRDYSTWIKEEEFKISDERPTHGVFSIKDLVTLTQGLSVHTPWVLAMLK